MAIISATAREGVVSFGHELKHQVEWAHTNRQQHTIVAVVWVGVVLGFELHTQGNLYGFVPARGGVHVFADKFKILFEVLGHGLGRSHVAECLC